MKRKYPTMIVRIFLVSARTHSISRYIHIQTLCVHKRNVLRFLQHATYHVVVRGGSHFCQSPKGGGSGVFLLKRKGGPTLFWEKIPKFPSPPPPPPRKNVPSLTFSNCDSNTDELFRDLNWSKLNHQRAVSKAIMMYNTIHNQIPGYLSSRFILRHEVLSYSLRNNECKLSIPQPRTNYCKRSFS